MAKYTLVATHAYVVVHALKVAQQVSVSLCRQEKFSLKVERDIERLRNASLLLSKCQFFRPIRQYVLSDPEEAMIFSYSN